jgi:hypothetical protein
MYVFNVSITNGTDPTADCFNTPTCYDQSLHKLYVHVN